ncbi:MAG: SAM-dependent methyltransferase [Acidimicrobiales bacterium]
MSDAAAYFGAYEEILTPLFAARNVLEIVAGAAESGLMTALAEPTRIAELVEQTGLSEDMAEALCAALRANDVVELVDDGRVVLTAPWRTLAAPAAFVPLGTAIDGNAVEGRLLRAGASSTYWSMPASDRLTFARSVSPDPFSDEVVSMRRAEIAADPVRSRLVHGGRLLELGCGLAGQLLTTLRALPEVHAVGVELSADLAEAAAARAAALGLADRFTVVCGDAASFTSDEPFDFGSWSQFFFPAASRSAALATLLSCLRPGGAAWAPVGVDFEAVRAAPTGDVARSWATFQLILRAWGVPERPPELLAAEFEAAGFVQVEVVPHPASPTVVGRRP